VAKVFYAGLLGLLGVVIVHICVLLLVPYYARDNTWAKLQQDIRQPYMMRPPAPDSAIATMSDPLLRLETCYFNLANGPVHIAAPGQVPFWSMSLYDHTGNNLYSLNNRTAPNGMLDVVISDPIQVIDFKQTMAEKYRNSVLTAQNIDKGFLILRVLQPSTDWHKQIDAFLSGASCHQANY